MRQLILALLLLVAGCGKIGKLQPVSADRAPPAPNFATVPPTSEQQLKRDPQAAPDRVDDPLRRSQDRHDDRFDLPPPGR